jgi:hypothetical protein
MDKKYFLNYIEKLDLSKEQKEKLEIYKSKMYWEDSEETINMRLKPFEKELLQAKAEKENTNLTTLVRLYILHLFLDLEI